MDLRSVDHDTAVPADRDESTMAELAYELSFKGVASDVLCAAFDDCELVAGHGTTLLRCDQEALQDVLERIQSFGLELLDVRLVAEKTDHEPP